MVAESSTLSPASEFSTPQAGHRVVTERTEKELFFVDLHGSVGPVAMVWHPWLDGYVKAFDPLTGFIKDNQCTREDQPYSRPLRW